LKREIFNAHSKLQQLTETRSQRARSRADSTVSGISQLPASTAYQGL